MDYKVSVIIPAYNARDYLVASVGNLLDQTLSELEVIVVNDCSQDDGMDLLKEHYGDNERVVLIDQPRNMGPGAARNAGVKAARGEYIGFVDADDAVLPDAFLKMYEAARDNKADILHTTGVLMPISRENVPDLLKVDRDYWLQKTLDEYEPADRITVLSDDISDRFEKWKKHAYHWAVWNKLYRREFLLENDLCFGGMKLSEDELFCFGCLFLAKRYVLMPGDFYLYRIFGDSLCRGKYTATLLERAVNSALDIVPLVNSLMDRIDFFKGNTSARTEVIASMLNELETYFIRPVYQEIGEASYEPIKKIFDERFGEYADYVYYTFFRLHENYPELGDDMKKATDANYLADMLDKKKAQKENK